MLISSLIGLVASLILSIEAITLATNPAAVLSCDISSKISCGVVAQTWRAQLFGWPNSFSDSSLNPSSSRSSRPWWREIPLVHANRANDLLRWASSSRGGCSTRAIS